MSTLPPQHPETKKYAVPYRVLQGNLAEMLFYDALYYLLAYEGEKNELGHRFVETDLEVLEKLTGLTRKTLRKQIDQAREQAEPFCLVEEEGLRPYSSLLKFRQFAAQQAYKHLYKAAGYMGNGWGWVLAQPYPQAKKSSRFPLAILNVLWRKPHGRLTSRDELLQRTRKAGSHTPPDTAVVQQALDHLQALGLLEEPTAGEYLLVHGQFAVDGRQQWQRLQQPLTAAPRPELIAWAEAQHPERTALALELIEIGQFDLATYFHEIFYALAEIQPETDWHWLRYAAHRHRHRPADAQRWPNCWQLFLNKLAEQTSRECSAKVRFDLSIATTQQLTLTLKRPRETALRWGKLVLWLNDHRFQASGRGRGETVTVLLTRDIATIWERTLTYEHELVRCDLTADMQTLPAAMRYQLHIHTAVPLPQFTVEAQLEAAFVRR